MTLSTSIEMRNVITAANEKFMDTFNKGDTAGLATLYTRDGQILPPNSDFVKGREAIQGFWQAVQGMGIKKAKLETLEVEDCSDTVFEVGQFTLYGADGQQLDQGKYIVIWKQEASEWKLPRDIFNSSMPTPG